MQAMLARPMTLGEDLSSASTANATRTRSYSSGSAADGGCASPSRAEKDVAPFLKNLRTMLDTESDAVLRWTPNGRAFEIHDMDEMMASVLPKYFKHRKYTSFQRQLNYFNFRKWTKSKATVCTFSNDFFLRDQPELAWRITRKKSLHHSSSSGGGGAAHSPLAAAPTHKFPSKPPSGSSSRVLTVPVPRMAGLPQQQSSPWIKAESVVISVPAARDLGSGRAPFPSPTDQDMMLKEHDRRHLYASYHQAQHPHPQPSFSAQLATAPQYPFASHALQAAGAAPEALDWIDCLLPPVDRIEDELYTYMYQSSACAAAATGGGGYAPKSSPYDFV